VIVKLSQAPLGFVLAIVITLWGAVAASTWGGWWHVVWVVGSYWLIATLIRDWPVDDRRRGMQ
jgi:hypothetical protein